MKPSPCKHGNCLGGQRDDWHLLLKRVIAATPPATWYYLPAQCKIIALCCRVLGSRFKVHIPQQGALGSLSCIKLATFARFTHTVNRFLLGASRGASGFVATMRAGNIVLVIARGIFCQGEWPTRQIFMTSLSGSQPRATDK